MELDGGKFTSSIPVATSLPHRDRGRDSVSHIHLHTAYHLSHSINTGTCIRQGWVVREGYAVCCVGGECVRGLSFGFV